jgi:nucleotide-binding universal stress UspA family protein
VPKRTILIACDIENRSESGRKRSEAVLNVATFLAQRLKTGIDLVYVEDLKTYPAARLGSFRYFAWHEMHEQLLDAKVRNFSVPAAWSLLAGSPADQIVQRTLSRPCPELIVMGTQGRRGVRRLLVGSVAEEVIRNSKRPVMVVGPAVWEQKPAFLNRKRLTILVPTDLGRNSRAAEGYALSLAERLGAGVTLFHCLWDSINAVMVASAYSTMSTFDIDQVIAASRSDAIDALKRKQTFFRKRGVQCEYRIEEKALTSSCAVYQESEGHSLVVMGTHGRNILLESFFGSTARETILHAAVPVIVVHSGT